MPSQKIIFKDDEYARIKAYKEATGVSVQRFVIDAVLERLEKVEVEQYLKDLPYLKED